MSSLVNKWHFEQEQKILDTKDLRFDGKHIETLFSQMGIMIGVQDQKKKNNLQHRIVMTLSAIIPKNIADTQNNTLFSNNMQLNDLLVKSYKPQKAKEGLEIYLQLARQLCCLRINGWHIVNGGAIDSGQRASWNHGIEGQPASLVDLEGVFYRNLQKKVFGPTFRPWTNPKGLLRCVQAYPVEGFSQQPEQNLQDLEKLKVQAQQTAVKINAPGNKPQG